MTLIFLFADFRPLMAGATLAPNMMIAPANGKLINYPTSTKDKTRQCLSEAEQLNIRL